MVNQVLTVGSLAIPKSTYSALYSLAVYANPLRAFNFGEFKDGKAQQPLPSTMVPLEPEIAKFFEHCSALCQRILYLLGVGLQARDFPF